MTRQQYGFFTFMYIWYGVDQESQKQHTWIYFLRPFVHIFRLKKRPYKPNEKVELSERRPLVFVVVVVALSDHYDLLVNFKNNDK